MRRTARVEAENAMAIDLAARDYTPSDIAHELNIPRQTLYQRSYRDPELAAALKRNRYRIRSPRTPRQEEILWEMWRQADQFSIEDIAAALGIHPKTATKWARQIGLPRREPVRRGRKPQPQNPPTLSTIARRLRISKEAAARLLESVEQQQ